MKCTNSSPTIVTIIGAGFSGTMVATHLLRSATFPLKIHLIERQTQVGQGVAYATQVESHLLNVPAGGMSAFPDRSKHFLEWLETSTSELEKSAIARANPEECSIIKPYKFIPRKLYGAYLRDVLNEAIATASDHVQLTRWLDEAISICPVAKGAVVLLRSGRSLYTHKIVLALGHSPPSDPPVQNRSFYKSQRYVGYAWSPQALNQLDCQDSVLLIGSGLTMLDLVVALREQEHQGTIHVVSRRGLLPQAHQYPAKHIHPSFLKADNAPRTIRTLVHQVRQEVQLASAHGRDWRSVIDVLRPILPILWQSLPVDEQQRFLRHVRPYWEILRHRAAPQVLATITEMLDSGQLMIHIARIHAYREESEAVNVILKVRNISVHQSLRVSRVINCTGPESDYRKLEHPLIVNLLQQGLIRPDPLNLGLDVALNGALIDRDGSASIILYTLGPPKKGCFWETTSVPEIRQQAKNLAEEMLRLSALSCSEVV
jgi:uncharacterized NAD(P)/FAD-binding protein YdhS